VQQIEVFSVFFQLLTFDRSAFTLHFAFLHYLILHFALKAPLFRRVVAFDRLGLDHAARVAFLPVLAFRRHRPRHVAARKQGGYCRHCYYTDYYFSHNFFLLLVDSLTKTYLNPSVVSRPFGLML
jgi:hypothetical protein